MDGWTMSLIRIPEMDMSIDELDALLQDKAERKSKLHDEMMQLEAELITIASILAAKAIKELGGV
jgi:hypothetical protein